MASYRVLTFLTDYGLEDGFVAACHGVAARIAPGVPVTDITHLVPPGDVRRGAAVLAQTVPYFPPAVHVVVVDPGVGTARRGVAVEAGDCAFVGPDNGVLSWAVAAAGGARRAVSLTNSRWWLDRVTSTFHGRDIFMPVGARVAAGGDIAGAGTGIDAAELVTLPTPASRVRDGTAEGEILTVDRFGNVQFSITAPDAGRAGVRYGSDVLIRCGGRELTVPYREMFGAVPAGELVAYADGAGFVALAVNAGNAAQRLGLRPGTHASLRPAP